MIIPILVLALLLLLNGVLAMSELAMMTARASRLQQSAARGHKGAAVALRLAAHPTRFLSTVQVGITLIGILSGAYAEKAISGKFEPLIAQVPALAEYSDEVALVLMVLVITYFSLLIGELIPKRLALAFPETVASAISRPLAVMSIIGAVPVKILTVSTEAALKILRVSPSKGDDVSEEDVRALVARAATTGVFTRQEHALIQRTMHVGALTVRDLMVPRVDVVWINEDMSGEDLSVLIGTSPYSHFPVCRGSLDQLVGVVHIKDLITYGLLAGRQFKVSAVARRPLFVPETMPALRLMDEFKRTKMHFAFVVDEYGATMGLLTINDLMSALIGDIGRRGEEPKPKAVQREDGSWLMDGRLPLREAMATMQITGEDDEDQPTASTVAGLVLGLLGHIPTKGEHTRWLGWRLEVVDVDGSRIDQVLVSRVPEGQ